MLNAQHQHFVYLLKQLAVAALYAVSLYISDRYFDNGAIVGQFETSSGLALAALLNGGKKYTWGVFLGAILVNAIYFHSFFASIVIASTDALQALFGAWMLTREGGFNPRIQSLRDYLRLILLGGCAANLMGTLTVNTILLLFGLLPSENYNYSLLDWWMSDTLGVILITPLIMVLWENDSWREARLKWEAIFMIGLMILCGQIIFLDLLHEIIGPFAKGYWMFLLISLVAMRLGTRGTVIALVVVAVQAMLGALQGIGYFGDDITNTHMVNYWFYILTLSITGMTLATYLNERKTYERLIKQLAYYDPLTELPNRRLLLERLKHGISMERREGKQLALLMLDLDRFKIVNDSLGHRAGDQLLQQVAARITARLRDVDMVARLGGDEFIVLLEDIAQPEDAARVAKEIITDLIKPFCLTQRDNVQIGVSIGISLYPQHGDSPELLIDHADAALYKVKDAGRGCFAYFSEAMTTAAIERIAFETRLRHAAEQQQLRVFYQPQVNIASGRIVGAEALICWEDPLEGLVPPLRFISIANESDLIVEIGSWALRETCLQGRKWLDEGLPPLTLAVKISPQQFRRSDICTLVATVLNDTGFPANQLELEITESGLMGNQDNTMVILNNLRAQGVNFAIDHFGTGYSSMAYLKRFPFDLLKIDKSFIEHIPFDQHDMEIASAIIAMGHIFGFKVLAEGVETRELLIFLKEQGCDIYQGHINSKPVSAQEFAELLRNQQ